MSSDDQHAAATDEQPEYRADDKGKIGEVLDHVSGKVCLRPPGGGVEFWRDPDELRPLDDSEKARVLMLTTPVGSSR